MGRHDRPNEESLLQGTGELVADSPTEEWGHVDGVMTFPGGQMA